MFRFLGFACVAALAVGFADYVNQAKATGHVIGTYPVSAYIRTIPQRLAEGAAARDKLKRRAEPAKAHLPEAPDGWERRAWVRDLEAELQARLDAMKPADRALAGQVANGFIGKIERKAAIKEAEAESAAQIWEYAKGNEIVRINARYAPVSETVDAADDALARDNAQGFAVIEGVPFFLSNPGGDDTDPRAFIAYMGDAITLRVHAQASDESIRLILGAIDYDGLNAMLDRPLPGVGSAAPALTREEERITAAQALEAHIRKVAKDLAALSQADPVAPRPEPAPKPVKPAKAAQKQTSRFKLSGGRDCLAGASGNLCRK